MLYRGMALNRELDWMQPGSVVQVVDRSEGANWDDGKWGESWTFNRGIAENFAFDVKWWKGCLPVVLSVHFEEAVPRGVFYEFIEGSSFEQEFRVAYDQHWQVTRREDKADKMGNRYVLLTGRWLNVDIGQHRVMMECEGQAALWEEPGYVW